MRAPGRRRQAELALLQGYLPQQLTSFVGRDDELADVLALLREARLLTVLGGGGFGKLADLPASGYDSVHSLLKRVFDGVAK